MENTFVSRKKSVSMNEEKHIKRLRKGDRNSFDCLYKKYSRQLYFFSLKFVKSDEIAQGIVQEVFLKIWENRKTLRHDTNFGSFIMTIAKNRILNAARKELRRQEYWQYENHRKSQMDNDTENQIIYRDLFKATEEVIELLPAKRKVIFRLSRNQGMSNQEIAEELDISVRTVESHIYKALSFLKLYLIKNDDNPSNSRQVDH